MQLEMLCTSISSSHISTVHHGSPWQKSPPQHVSMLCERLRLW